MTKLTLFDKALGYVSAPYKTRAMQHRQIQNAITDRESGVDGSARRAGRTGRTDKTGYSQQPWGVWGTRTYTSATRRVAVRKSRQIYENNVLGRAMLDRATDNIIGEGMYVVPKSSDDGFNAEAEAFWKNYQGDARGMVDNATLQRHIFRDWKRDGDRGAAMTRSGTIQAAESDLIQSPQNEGDTFGRAGRPEIVDGFRLATTGRPKSAFVQVFDNAGRLDYAEIPMRNFLYIADTDRSDYTAVRGVPALATIGWLLEQIDGTIEAVVMAHRMAAMFGLVVQKQSPGKAIGNLPLKTNASGDSQAQITLEPGMMAYLGLDETLAQVKPEQPTQGYDMLMTSLVRFAGLNFGLPLELALMDFSKTNYSSARASMEQAYRGFRVQQQRFASCWLSKWYRWRIAKAVKLGEITGAVPADYLNHQWYGQPWPYLNPVDDAQGTMALIGAGKTTLTEELAKRGMSLDEWIEIQSAEINKASEAGVTLQRSSATRDAVMPEQASNDQLQSTDEQPQAEA